MAERTPLPKREQLEKLLEKLLPPNEEMDEVSAAVILESAGVDRSKLSEDLSQRLKRRIEELQAEGADVPPQLIEALTSLRPEAEPEDQVSPDPEDWIKKLLSGSMPGNLSQSSGAGPLQSFRARNMEFLSEEDQKILEELVAELQLETDEEG